MSAGPLVSVFAMAPLSMPKIAQTMKEFFEHQVDHSSRLWALFMLGNWRLHTKQSG